MSRRAIFYDVPAEVVRTLTGDYEVTAILSLNKLEPMKEVLRTGEYDVVVANADAPRVDVLERAVKVFPHVTFVSVSCKGPAESVTKAIVKAARWSMTTFVVVTATKGGVGKSTVVGGLAMYLAHPPKEKGHKPPVESNVLVVDDNPNQSNAAHLLTDHPVMFMPISEMQRPADYLSKRIMRLDDRLSLLTPDEYNSQGGISFGVASLFWDSVAALGYDYVIVDTMPSFGTPDTLDEWTDVTLTYALIAGTYRAIYVIPFTPDQWGHDGLTKTRDLLAREKKLDFALPVVVCTDGNSVAENIPPWLNNDGWRGRLVVVPYNNRIRVKPKSLRDRATMFHNALSGYKPVAGRVQNMAAASYRRAG